MRTKELFLPDFCSIRNVFAVVVMGQLLSFVLVLAATADAQEFWYSLGLVSLFVQWIVVASAAALCVLRRRLARIGNIGAAIVAYAVILLITAVVSESGSRLLGEAVVEGPRYVFVLRSLGVAAIVGAVMLRYLYVVHEWKRRLESEAAARIDALQARIRPHFLFNSLNTIAYMIPADPAKAEEAVEDMADLFRASLGDSRTLRPLADEIDLSRRYLRMESLRLGERLRVDWRLGELPLDALIPLFTLQPLLENAVYHGIESRLDGGTIHIEGSRERGMLRLMLRNPRPQKKNARYRREGIGMAQQNIRERLALAFGNSAGLKVAEVDDEYRVELFWPYRRQSQ